jgi:hypothetical protein
MADGAGGAAMFTNPVAFENGEEEASPKALSKTSGSENPSFDSESASAAKLAKVKSEDVSSAPVLPESLENTKAGSAQVEAWKERLVEHIIQGKENLRDKRRREATETLQGGSLIDPNGLFRRKWDMIQIVLLIYVAFSVPYRTGFSDGVKLWSGWFWFDLLVDLYFVSDLVVSFKTAFYNGAGELVVDQKEIRQNYFRSWFIVDISPCFPGNYISYAIRCLRQRCKVASAFNTLRAQYDRYAVEENGDRSSRMIKLLRMLRLLKLLRLARLNRLVRRYEEEFASLMTTFKLAKLVILIIVVGHWYVLQKRAE